MCRPSKCGMEKLYTSMLSIPSGPAPFQVGLSNYICNMCQSQLGLLHNYRSHKCSSGDNGAGQRTWIPTSMDVSEASCFGPKTRRQKLTIVKLVISMRDSPSEGGEEEEEEWIPTIPRSDKRRTTIRPEKREKRQIWK